MSVAACADLVRRGDPDRFRAVMAAPRETRARLFTLYAFNLEVARAPWVTQEPLIAEMRLQWWRDVVADAGAGVARAHAVAGPLHALIRDSGLPVAVLDRLIAARRRDIDRAPFAGPAELEAYLADTGAGLMWLAARALGAPDAAEAPVRAYGWASAAAGYLCAVPALVARGRLPLPDALDAAGLARLGLDRLAEARGGRRAVPRTVAPALLPGWQAAPILARALADPAAVAAGRLGLAEVRRRGRLLWQAATGRW